MIITIATLQYISRFSYKEIDSANSGYIYIEYNMVISMFPYL